MNFMEGSGVVLKRNRCDWILGVNLMKFARFERHYKKKHTLEK